MSALRSSNDHGAAADASSSIASSPVYRLTIEPDAPFRLDLTVWALRRRPHNMVDRWEASTYWRTLPVDGEAIAVGVTQSGTADAPRLSVSFADAGLGRSAETSACDACTPFWGWTSTSRRSLPQRPGTR